jgi:hypothetical protein
MLKAQSEPPPSESTQMYDQRELSRLLEETDPTLAQEVLNRTFSENSFIHPRPSNEKPTIRPPALAPLSKPRVELKSTLPNRLPHDTVPDTDDEPTVMYRRSVIPSPAPFAGSTLHDTSNIELVCLSSSRPKGEELTVANPRPFNPRSSAANNLKGIGTPKQQSAVATSISKTVSSQGAHANENKDRTVTDVRNCSSSVENLSFETNPQAPQSRQQRRRSRLAMFLTWLLGSSILVVALLLTIVTSPSYFGTRGQYLKANVEKGLLATGLFRDVSEKTNSPAPKQRVDVTITIEPPQAKLFLDGLETSNPFKASVPVDNILHEIRGESVGHAAKTHRLKFDRNVSIVLGL